MQRNNRRRDLLIYTLVSAIASCLPPKKKVDIGATKAGNKTLAEQMGHASSPNSIQLQMPNLNLLQSNGPINGAAGVSLTSTIESIVLTVSPVVPNCKDATKFAETLPYTDAVITKRLTAGCEYKVLVALSGKGFSGSDVVYYAMLTAKGISPEELARGPIPVMVTLASSGALNGPSIPQSIASVKPGS